MERTLNPISIRLFKDQEDQLRARSKADMVPLQRHIRRAIDLYLALLANPSGPQLIEKLLGFESLPANQAKVEHELETQKVVFT